jgi:hypothetical protein
MENSFTKTAKRKNVQIARPVSNVKIVTEDAIRQRAFEIYLNNLDNSNEIENWLRAERELKEHFK